MSDHKDLYDADAIAKLKELAEDINVCMFCTELSVRPIPTRPMALQEVDGQGNFWFLSSASSNKNFEIKHDDDVQLIFAKNSDAHFLSVFGTAIIYKDQEHINDQWSPMAKAWFTEGKKDPDVSVIKVTPAEAYYWDTKNGKMVTMLQAAARAITGNHGDDGGIEGAITL